MNAVQTIADAVRRRSIAEIEQLILALPAREDRGDDESTVAIGLKLAYKRAWRELLHDVSTAELVDLHESCTDTNGYYRDGADGLDSCKSDAILQILEGRYGDIWDAWELHPGFVPNDHPESGARFLRAIREIWITAAAGDVS